MKNKFINTKNHCVACCHIDTISLYNIADEDKQGFNIVIHTIGGNAVKEYFTSEDEAVKHFRKYKDILASYLNSIQ